MELIKPKKLNKGDTIGLMSPSSHNPKEEVEQTQQALEKAGYHVVVPPQSWARYHSGAGQLDEKLSALHGLFADSDIKAIFCLRGGYQALHLLDRLDYDLIRRHPKILIGFSDITALQGAILKQAGLVSFHGVNGRSFRHLGNEAMVLENNANHAMLEMLAGTAPDNLFHEHSVNILKPGTATGRIFGGNLQLIAALIEAGDIYHPDFKECILVVEDLGEEIAKLDRQLGAWRLRGIFKQIAGLVVGYMTDIRDTPGVAGPFVHTVKDILLCHTGDLTGPLVVNAPFGHEEPNYPFPQGVMAQLEASGEKTVFTLLESPFSAG